jgi:pimeloyl-ACP methyl ester carboxylesterase
MKIPQRSFAELPDSDPGKPVVVHQHEGRANTRLIVLVHGLGGQRYGPKATWGRFPDLLFEDSPDADVALYSYRTLFGRLNFSKSVELEAEAKVFAGTLRDELASYASIVLIGHSMGGLLCKAAICELIWNQERETLARIGGLILMATPQLGSLRMPGWLRFLSPDARALVPHGRLAAKVSETFEDHLTTDETVLAANKVVIPTWAVLGVSDFWVDPLSAGMGLPSNRRKIVRGSHTSVVKPRSRDEDVYTWVRDRITTSFRTYQYDVFLASAMAGLDSEAKYEAYKKDALAIEQALIEACGFRSVFYAGRDLSWQQFESASLSLEEDVEALRRSRFFFLMYPERIVSSVLFEAGLALAFGKPAVYFVTDRRHLPFLMAQAGDAAVDAGVRVYETAGLPEILKLIEFHGEKLWKHRASG